MKNVAEFPKAKENIRMLFDIWEKLDGNAQSFEPIRNMKRNEETKAVVTKWVDRFTKTGKPMIECTWTELDTGRSATVYQWRDKAYQQYKNLKIGDVCLINSQENKGFFNVSIKQDLAINMQPPRRPNGLSAGAKHRTLLVYDIEVFSHDILIEVYDYFNQRWFEFENDLNGYREFYLQYRDSLWVGYNNGGYDNHVVRGYLQGKNPYKLSKTIIDGDRNDIYKEYNTKKTTLFSMDLYMDNRGFSLKEHSGFMGIDIRETQVDFDIDRPLTDKERILNRIYCKNDVLATIKRMEQNSGMLLAKMAITGMFDLDKTAIGMTNANLTGKLLQATKTPDRKDEQDPYELPESLQIETSDVLDTYVGREFPLNDKGKVDIALTVPRRDLEEVLGVGGLHGAKKSYIRIGKFHFRDVGSLYPNTMRIFNLMSRNIPDEELHIYSDLLDRRLEAKYSDEKTTQVKGVTIPTKVLVNGIKLPLNTKYGAMGAQFNVLFDKRMRLHVCITGQLAMFDLLEKIEPHATIMQSNTDAHAFIPFSEEDAEAIDQLCNEWEERTGYTLDDDLFKAMYQKDVNNYIAVDEDNEPKIKGAIGLTHGLKISKAIVSNAFINYILADKPFGEFIDECDELRQYQIITKTGYTYQRTVTMDANGNTEEAQKVNRVFAVKSPEHAIALYKVKENTFTSKADVIRFVKEEKDKNNDVPEMTDLALMLDETEAEVLDVKDMLAKYEENKDEDGVWEWVRYTVGVPNAPEYYQISNEEVGTGITIEDVDKNYYKDEVEKLLVQWFGANYEERIKEAHSNPDFEPLPVKNYID